jgi:GGDEF domain-containing protein
VRSSLGCSTFPEDGRSTAELLAAADAALYEHKRARTRSGERPEPPPDDPGERRRHRRA